MVPLDGKNLNRSFPGDPRGSAAERIAAAVTEELIKGSDYVIDLHAGDLPEALEPFVFYDASPVERQARELALAYGLGHMVRQSSDGRTVTGSTSAAAADLGIPSFTAESGECGILARDAVDRHLRGLRNVLRQLRLLPGDAVAFDRPVEHDGWIWMRTTDAGWWQPAVATGASVAEGDLLGTVSPIIGGTPTPHHRARGRGAAVHHLEPGRRRGRAPARPRPPHKGDLTGQQSMLQYVTQHQKK